MKRNLFRRALACLCLCAVLSGGLCVPARAAGFRMFLPVTGRRTPSVNA